MSAAARGGGRVAAASPRWPRAGARGERAEAIPGRRDAALGRRVLVLGGTSEIALAIVDRLQELAPREVALAGRDPAGLADAAERLRAKGCPRVSTLACDALDTGAHAQALARAWEELGGGVELAIVAVGELGDPDALGEGLASAVHAMQVNFVGAGSLLLHAARRMREQGAGTIVVLSSVAAQRPRRANPAYGAGKAGLDALATALGDELQGDGVRVLIVRPGFVRTRMTRGLTPAPLATTPQAVADAVAGALRRGARAVWAPRALRGAMLIVRMLPRALFRRIAR